MSIHDITTLADERKQSDWSADSSGLPASATSATAIAALRDQTTQARHSDLVPVADKDMLVQFGLLTPDANELSNAGAIVVGHDPERWPRVRYSHRQTSGTEPVFSQTLQAPLLEVLRSTLSLVSAHTHSFPLNLPDGTQIQITDYPSGAIREGIANALLHCDYRLSGSITIEHSEDSLRIISPGLLPRGVTPNNILTHSSQPRNTKLFRFAELIRIAEERGLGIDRMVRESIKAGNPAPQILENGEQTLVVFTTGKRSRPYLHYVMGLPPHERDNVDTLLILYSLLTSKTVTNDNVVSLIQKTPDETAIILRRLAALPESSFIEPTLESKARKQPVYRLTVSALQKLGSAVSYNKPPTDDIERKVTAHLLEFKKISNKTLRNLLDVDVYKARDILKRLVNDEIIERTSEQSRGRNVEYGPGEKLRLK